MTLMSVLKISTIAIQRLTARIQLALLSVKDYKYHTESSEVNEYTINSILLYFFFQFVRKTERCF